MESVVRTCSLVAAIAPRLALAMILGGTIWCQPVEAARIHAERGRTYSLTREHGPWMIMVTSLWGSTPEQDEQANKAANELVYQLRVKGIPAYTYSQDDQIEEIESVDRMGRPRIKKLTAQHGMIGVLAGNYETIDDKAAQQTLKIIKKLNTKVTVDWHGKKTDVPIVLTKAFMTRNPLMPRGDQSRKYHDPLILKLNSGDHTLLANKGKYTVVVASFYGKSQIKPKEFEKFDRMLEDKTKISLDNAAQDSWELMQMLRSRKVHGGPYDAYVFHDRFRSVVTVGAFKSKDDPEIARLIGLFKAKETVHPETKQTVTVCESIQIPGPKPNSAPKKAWTLDPYPQVIEVPK